MSRRTSIVNALVKKLKLINGVNPYKVNISNNAYPILKFWNEVEDLPAIYVTAGPEHREYLPAGFAWVFMTVCMKVYCKGETSQLQLENLLEDIERVIDTNQNLEYDTVKHHETTQILVQSIVTDEGLLAPYAVGEITVQFQYQKM